jgi:hypothetical protein
MASLDGLGEVVEVDVSGWSEESGEVDDRG